MSRKLVRVVAVFGSLILPQLAFAQALPPAGSAGAGNAPISGVPYGAANPRSASDPSGIGNAGSVPSLRSNFGAATVPPSPQPATRVVTPPSSLGGSSRIVSAHEVEPKGKTPPRKRGRPEVSHFTGICRGC